MRCFSVEVALQEDYVVKSVDLLSGIGGTLGLWLGLSFLSLGTFLIETASNARQSGTRSLVPILCSDWSISYCRYASSLMP